MNGFRNFMLGRYGTDQLTAALLIIGMVLTFTGDAFNFSLLTLISYTAFFACIFRTMSKNIGARQKENQKFLRYWNPVGAWLTAKYRVLRSSKDYKYFSCPSCKKELRAPRGKGKIAVTCQKCGTRFIQNT